MRQSVLTEPQARFLREEKESLAGIQLALAKLDLPREALDSLQQAILQLDELFLIVIAGEFNAGKSALVNALLGGKVLPEGATPTTSRVTLVKCLGTECGFYGVGQNVDTSQHSMTGVVSEFNVFRCHGDYSSRSDLKLFNV